MGFPGRGLAPCHDSGSAIRLQLNRVDLGLEMCVVCPFAGKHLTTTKSLSQLSVPLKSYHFQDPKGITQQVLSEQLVTK